MDDGRVSEASQSNPLHDLLGGRRGALESALPSVVFVVVYLLSGPELGLALVSIGLGAVAGFVVQAFEVLGGPAPIGWAAAGTAFQASRGSGEA